MKHKLGLWSLVATGLGSIIGSGWLFSAYKAAKFAGSGAFLAWGISALIIILLALTIAEIATLFPLRGLFTRVLAISHNKDMGYITAIANWLGILAVIPTEAMATIQYLAGINETINHALFLNNTMTTLGSVVVTGLVLLYSLLNFWGTKVLAHSNNIITVFKFWVPVITALAIIITSFHPGNFVAEHHKLLPYGMSSVFSAIMSSGIIYAFNGFQTIANFAAEVHDPAKTIPRALIIAILLGLFVYLLLQTAFIGGLPPKLLEGGWSALSFQSPIVQLTSLLGLNLISLVLYADACVSPSGTGIVYTGATVRMLTAMSQEKQAPSFFNHLHPKYNFSRRSLIFNTAFCLCLLWFFPSWDALVVIVSLFHIISYMASPIALMRLRLTIPHETRHYKLPFAAVLCPILFVFITLLFCLTPQKDLVLVTMVSIAFYLMYIFVSNRGKISPMWYAFKRSYSLMLYFVVLTALGFLGNPKSGGFDLISHTTFYILMTVISLIFYFWLVYAPISEDVEAREPTF